MKVQTYFRICLFVPLIVPLPFLLFKADEGLSSLIIGSLVFGMPPYILFILLPFIFLFGKMSEKQIIIGIIFFPFVYPLIFGLFWSIVPNFINTVKITLSNPSQWIFTTVVFTAAYSMIFISGYILRKLILKESDIHEQSLAAILCADIKGYGQHMKEDEAGTLSRLNSYQNEFERNVQDHNGGILQKAFSCNLWRLMRGHVYPAVIRHIDTVFFSTFTGCYIIMICNLLVNGDCCTNDTMSHNHD